jgi:predicted DNA-binding ribbon-helix-helix protein
MKSLVIKRSIVIKGRKTSISLEDDFWRAFKEIASARGLRLTELVGTIASDRTGNLSSAIRLFVLNHYRELISTAAAQDTQRKPSLDRGRRT